MKTKQMEAEMFHIDMAELTFAVCNFENVPKTKKGAILLRYRKKHCFEGSQVSPVCPPVKYY
jgi:hypothetical protein